MLTPNSESFHHYVAAFFTEEASSTPAEGYLMSCDLTTVPAPHLDHTCVELVTIIFHDP